MSSCAGYPLSYEVPVTAHCTPTDPGLHHWFDLPWLGRLYHLSTLWALVQAHPATAPFQHRSREARPLEPAVSASRSAAGIVLHGPSVAVWLFARIAFY